MIRLSIGNSRMEKHWNLVEMELSEFRDRISHTCLLYTSDAADD